MRVIKSNGNYKLYYSGFHYIVECYDDTNDAREFYKLVNACKEMYGEETTWACPEGSKYGQYIWNSNWRYDINKKLKRRRLYLKNETDITLLMLKAK